MTGAHASRLHERVSAKKRLISKNLRVSERLSVARATVQAGRLRSNLIPRPLSHLEKLRLFYQLILNMQVRA